MCHYQWWPPTKRTSRELWEKAFQRKLDALDTAIVIEPFIVLTFILGTLTYLFWNKKLVKYNSWLYFNSKWLLRNFGIYDPLNGRFIIEVEINLDLNKQCWFVNGIFYGFIEHSIALYKRSYRNIYISYHKTVVYLSLFEIYTF